MSIPPRSEQAAKPPRPTTGAAEHVYGGAKVGDRIRLGFDQARSRYWWTVKAQSDRFTILTRHTLFAKSGCPSYTVVDRLRGVRGPCNLIGQGWGDGTYTEAECTDLLVALQGLNEDMPWVEVSYRNNVPVEVLDVEHIPGGGR